MLIIQTGVSGVGQQVIKPLMYMPGRAGIMVVVCVIIKAMIFAVTFVQWAGLLYLHVRTTKKCVSNNSREQKKLV